MTILLLALAAAFAAFCAWLTVRIVNRNEKWAKRTAMTLLAILIVYPLSAGPAALLVVHVLPPAGKRAIFTFYIPMTIINEHSQWSNDLFFWYVYRWVDRDALTKAEADS